MAIALGWLQLKHQKVRLLVAISGGADSTALLWGQSIPSTKSDARTPASTRRYIANFGNANSNLYMSL